MGGEEEQSSRQICRFLTKEYQWERTAIAMRAIARNEK
jgi:hypothetical protein